MKRIEKFASFEHDRWCKWMSYTFEKGTYNPDGSWTMPSSYVKRWGGVGK